MSKHALFVASGDVNSDKAINLLALLDTLAPHVDVIDVRTQDPASLPAWVNGVPVFYNARLKCPGRGSHGLEQMIEEDTHMKSAGPAGPAMTGATTTMPGSMPGSMRGPPRPGHQAPSVGTVSGKGGKKASLAGVAGWASSFAKGIDRSDPKSVERMREKAMEEAIRRRDAMGDPFNATS